MNNLLWAKTCDFVQSKMHEHEIVGLGLGIFFDGQSYSQGFGVTSIDNPLPVTENTIFLLGSITKTYISSLIMQLIEAGKLHLEDKVQQIIPNFRLQDESATEQLTLRHLLCHKGGWDGDFFIDTGLDSDAHKRYIEQMVCLPQISPVGKYYSYNNSGFSILAHILEQVYEQSLEKIIHEKIFEPLGMTKSFLHPLALLTERFAIGHFKQGTAPKQITTGGWYATRATFGTGQIGSSVKDQLKYAQTYLNGGILGEKRILEAASIREMFTPQAEINKFVSYGLGWGLKKFGTSYEAEHLGLNNAQMGHLHIVPEKQFAVVILTNCNFAMPFLEEVFDFVVREYLGIELVKPVILPSSLEQKQELAGVYAKYNECLTISCMDNRLVGLTSRLNDKGVYENFDPPFRLDFCDDGGLIILDGFLKDWVNEIIRNDDGSIAYLRMFARLYCRKSC